MTRSWAIFALTLICSGSMLVSTAYAQGEAHSCTASATAGQYSVSCDGWTAGPGGQLVPIKQIGTVAGDTSGFWTGTTTVNIAGQTIIPNATVSGQAVFNPDCTGTITYNKGTPTELDIFFVVNPKKDELVGLVTNKGSIISCRLDRMTDKRDRDK